MKTCHATFSVVVGLAISLTACGQTKEGDKPSPPAPAAPAAPAQPKMVPPKPAAPPPQQVVNPPYTMFKDQHTGKQLQLPMIQRSVLNGVPGKLNQMAVDPALNRLYVAAKAKNSLEILDISTNKQAAAVPNLPEPNGVLLVPDARKLVVSCGGDNSVRVFSLSAAGDPSEEKNIKFEGETESIRLDAPNKRIYVSHGKNLGSFSLDTFERGKSLELPGMAKSFSIDAAADKIYVNIPSTGTVAVVKRSAATGDLTLETTWKIKDLAGNYPMALDAAAGHLFVVTRSPSSMFVVLDTKTGQQVAALPCVDQVESLWWDPVNKRAYASGGGSGGHVDVFQQATDPAKGVTYAFVHREDTNAGAGTSILVPEQRRLIVLAPVVGGSPDPTFVYVFLIGP